ncbi:MAG: hypothetical protein ACR2O0_10200 [Rhizobiaceae bacterium]
MAETSELRLVAIFEGSHHANADRILERPHPFIQMHDHGKVRNRVWMRSSSVIE